MYKAPLPELPFETSGCDEQAAAILDTYVQNEIDLLNPKFATQDYVTVAETNDWYITPSSILVYMIPFG